jgi:alpha-ketoglutarate-dependent taurine dioxygenase
VGEISILECAQTLCAIDTQSVLRALEKDGLCLVKSISDDPLSEDLQGFVSEIGMPHQHNERGTVLWDVRPCSESPEAARSHTALPFPMHTDCSFEDPTPRYLALQVVRADSRGGGLSLFARVKDVLDKLSLADQEVLKGDFTFKIPAEFHKGVNRRRLPILANDSFRYRREILLDCTRVQEEVLDKMEEALTAPGIVFRCRLERGTVLLLDNHRYLHGRTTILDPERHLRRVRFQPL